MCSSWGESASLFLLDRMWLWAVGDGGRRSWAPQPSAESQPLQADSVDRSWQFRLSRKTVWLSFFFVFFVFSSFLMKLNITIHVGHAAAASLCWGRLNKNIKIFPHLFFFLLNATVRSHQMIKNTQIASTNSINAVVVSHRNRALMQSVPFRLACFVFFPPPNNDFSELEPPPIKLMGDLLSPYRKWAF